MKVKKYKRCLRCWGDGRVGDPLGTMDICPECRGEEKIAYWEDEAPPSPEPPVSKTEMNWCCF